MKKTVGTIYILCILSCLLPFVEMSSMKGSGGFPGFFYLLAPFDSLMVKYSLSAFFIWVAYIMCIINAVRLFFNQRIDNYSLSLPIANLLVGGAYIIYIGPVRRHMTQSLSIGYYASIGLAITAFVILKNTEKNK